MKPSGSFDCTIVEGDEYPTAGRAHAPRSCHIFTGLRRPALGVAGGNNLMREFLTRGPNLNRRLGDLHFGILKMRQADDCFANASRIGA
jgi:hypothetical protein